MLNKILQERNTEPLKTREEMLEILEREEYGYLPQKPDSISFSEDEEYQIYWHESHSLRLTDSKKVNVLCKFGEKEFSFPLYVSIPKNSNSPCPLIVNLSHRKDLADFLFPSELVARQGFARVAVCYTDITSDNDDFTNGLAGVLFENGKREQNDAGKIALWAWGAMIALDYADSCGIFDKICYAVCGHERLGKAALLAAAKDERFAHVFANGSGQSGAALSCGKVGETIKDITKSNPYFFCKKYIEKGDKDFDQHYLLASVAPRCVYISGASEDKWCDPISEFISCLAASDAYEAFGKKGLVCGNILPSSGDAFHDGNIGFHLRNGEHNLSRYDWEKFIDFIKKQRGEYKEKKTNNLKELLEERRLPPLKSREEMLEILQKEEYGYLPPKPDSISFKETLDYLGSSLCAGKAVSKKIDITVSLYGEEFTFPVYMTVPAKAGRFPFFVCVNFQKDSTVFDRMIPTDDIIENDFAVLTFGYQDITKDNNNFTDGLAGVLYKDKERGASDPSKIAMWAWAAHRVLDYAETQDKLDMNCAIVCGHSRLGKTALLAAATDERFKYAHSNNSGASGAALSRGKIGESQPVMSKVSRWFCYDYVKYADDIYKTPFDQHYLLASIAPRYVYVASAYEDTWADPDSEFLGCVAASEEFEKHGKKGIVCDDRLPEIGDEWHDGSIGYHLREGVHYFAKEDWQKLIKFIKKHESEESKPLVN